MSERNDIVRSNTSSIPHFLLNWEIRNARKKKERNFKRNEKRKTFYLRLLNNVVRTSNNSNNKTNSNKVVPLDYDDSNSNDIGLYRVSVDSVEKLKAEAKILLEVPDMSVDLQAAQLAKDLQLGRNEIINLCNRSFNLYQRLEHIRDVSSKLNSRIGGVGCYGGHIARLLKSPGPHNGHRYIKNEDRLVTETSFQVDLKSDKKKKGPKEKNNIPTGLFQPSWDHNFNKAMLLTPEKFKREKSINTSTAEDIFKPLLKSSRNHNNSSNINSFITNDRPATPTTKSNTVDNITTPNIDTTDNDDDLDNIVNSPLKKSNSEVWLKLKKLWISVSVELKHAGEDITYDDLLEISTMKECPPHIMHLLGYFLALLGKKPDWPGICMTLFRNLQWWLQLIKSIDTSVCSVSRCEKAHELKLLDPEMYPPICNMKISRPIFKLIRWVNAFDFLILIIMEINKDIKSSVNIDTNNNRKNSKKDNNNNVLAYFGLGQHENIEMLNLFLEDDKNETKSDDDFEQIDDIYQQSVDNNISHYKKNVTFNENCIEDAKEISNFTTNTNNNDDYMDDYNDDYENDELNDDDSSAKVKEDSNAKLSEDINHGLMLMDMLEQEANENSDGNLDTVINDVAITNAIASDKNSDDDIVNQELMSMDMLEQEANENSDGNLDTVINDVAITSKNGDDEIVKADVVNDDDDGLLQLLESLGFDDELPTTIDSKIEETTKSQNQAETNEKIIPNNIEPILDTNNNAEPISKTDIKGTTKAVDHCAYCNVAKTHLHTFSHHPYVPVRFDNSAVNTCSNCRDTWWSFREEAEATLDGKIIADGELSEQICALCSDCPEDDLVLCSNCPRSFCISCLSKLKSNDTNISLYDNADKNWICMCCYNNQSITEPTKNNSNIDDNYDDEFDF